MDSGATNYARTSPRLVAFVDATYPPFPERARWLLLGGFGALHPPWLTLASRAASVMVIAPSSSLGHEMTVRPRALASGGDPGRGSSPSTSPTTSAVTGTRRSTHR